jgi:predicted RecB family nuclease
LALYSDLLADVQGVAPEHIHVVLGDNRRVSLRLADYRSYVRHLRLRLEDFIASPSRTRPEPVPACELCRWREHCAQEWDRTDSLCLLPGIRKSQRHKLEAAGAATITDLVQHTSKVPKLADETLAKLRSQARLRSARRTGGAPAFELRPLQPDKGVSRLPKPARGDLFFDMEGDPLIEGGLEYLFGIYTEAKGAGQFHAFWAHDRTAEREATQQVLEFFNAHVRAHPQAHIYHYGHYELTALKRLASGHGVGEALLDQLLRQQRFVDLYRIVQQGLITTEGGASLKDLEVFYEYERPKDSIVAYEKWRDSQDDAVLESIRAYNEADCRSTKGLRDWLAHTVRPAHLSWWKPTKFASEKESKRDKDTLRAEHRRCCTRPSALATDRGSAEGIETAAPRALMDQRIRRRLVAKVVKSSKPPI